MEEIHNQLSQMKVALSVAEENDKPGIQMIIDQLEELVTAYEGNQSTQSGTGGTTESSSKDTNSDDQDEEYRLFQSEIASLDPEKSSDSVSNNDTPPEQTTSDAVCNSIGSELEDLIGMKCMAPHQESWGQIGYYCAMISSVSSLDEDECQEGPDGLSSIMVRVVFLQPVVKSQLLCPFFKTDRCKFSDESCKFSHGEIIPLSQLKEYSEPDYSSIVPGTKVLAKYHDDLWYKASVQRITTDGECEVSYDIDGATLVLPLHETSPLKNSDDSSSDSSDEDDIQYPNLSEDSDEEEFPKTLMGNGDEILKMNGTSSLGDWEKHTKGIGSKLMMKMGYVFGTGLGRNNEGRVEPVDAIVLPPGKSLDACMALKEKAKDGNLFSAEKRRLKLQRRAEKQRAKEAAKPQKEEATVFEFLNSKLTLRKNKSTLTGLAAGPGQRSDLRKQTSISLNKQLLGVDENLKQVKKDILKTKESMKRQKGRDKETYAIMERKLEELERKQRELNSAQNTITNEQKYRNEKKKLVLF